MTTGKKPSLIPASEVPDNWTKENILKAASATGKPLEVDVAHEFIDHNWIPYIGTYYFDHSKQIERELDVLAERRAEGGATNKRHEISLRAFVSCRVIPPKQRPVAYYVPPKANRTLSPRFPHFAIQPQVDWSEEIWKMLPDGVFREDQRISSLDAFVENENQKEAAKLPLKSVGDGQMGDKTRTIYSALDSAIKATTYWKEADRRAIQDLGDHLHSEGRKAIRGIVYVPILVLNQPWIAVKLDRHTREYMGETEMGLMTILYPQGVLHPAGVLRPERITCLIVARHALALTIQMLEKLFHNFAKAIMSHG